MPGIEQILLSPAAADAGGRAWLDMDTRGVYDLLAAARAAGVARVVVLSTMDLFLAYPEAYNVGPGQGSSFSSKNNLARPGNYSAVITSDHRAESSGVVIY